MAMRIELNYRPADREAPASLQESRTKTKSGLSYSSDENEGERIYNVLIDVPLEPEEERGLKSLLGVLTPGQGSPVRDALHRTLEAAFLGGVRIARDVLMPMIIYVTEDGFMWRDAHDKEHVVKTLWSSAMCGTKAVEVWRMGKQIGNGCMRHSQGKGSVFAGVLGAENLTKLELDQLRIGDQIHIQDLTAEDQERLWEKMAMP